MSKYTDFFPLAGGGGGGGLTPKFQDFTTSGTFTATSNLISAGGFIQVLIVGGGCGAGGGNAGQGGEAQIIPMYLTSTGGVTVTVGAGGGSSGGSASEFFGAGLGGINISSRGGQRFEGNINCASPSWGSPDTGSVSGPPIATAGNGIFGYGAGAAWGNPAGAGVRTPKPNTGQGAYGTTGASGFVRVMWYE
jgi:hypothetical protein